MKLKPVLLSLFVTFIFISAMGQNPRSLSELINKEDSAWPLLQEQAKKAKNKVELLPIDSEKGAEALYQTQVTTRSPMGAIVYHSGGILVENGWLRILGGGGNVMKRSLPSWNAGKGIPTNGAAPAYLLIADDAAGGFFLLNGGGLGDDRGAVYYLDPSTLELYSILPSYSHFIAWAMECDFSEFYKDLRWKGFEKDLKTLKPDEAFNFYPFLWTKEGQDIDKVSRKAVPIEEQFYQNLELARLMGMEWNLIAQ